MIPVCLCVNKQLNALQRAHISLFSPTLFPVPVFKVTLARADGERTLQCPECSLLGECLNATKMNPQRFIISFLVYTLSYKWID